MKVRNGLVSNSSSSSFTVLLTGKEPDAVKILRLALGTLLRNEQTPGALGSYTGTVTSYKKMIREEIRLLEKDLQTAKERIEEFADLMKEIEGDPALLEKLNRLKHAARGLCPCSSSEARTVLIDLRLRREYDSQIQEDVVTDSTSGTKRLRGNLETIVQRISHLNATLEKLPKARRNQKILRFSTDHYYRHQIAEILGIFQGESWATIIEEEST